MSEDARHLRYQVTVDESPDHTFETKVIDREDGPAARAIATGVGRKYAADNNLGDVSIRVELISERSRD